MKKKKSFSNQLYLAVIALFSLHSLYVIFRIWNNLNIFQIDLAGHISSAFAFKNGYFHSFFDGFFQGNVHNLFYTPLQDLIITIISFLPFIDIFLAYKIYLSLIVIALSATIIYFTKNFKHYFAKTLFLVGFFLILLIDKEDAIFMGISWFDMFVYGLSNQFLGFIFLLLFINSILNKKSYKLQTTFLVLAMLSHLVIAITGFCMLLLFLVLKPKLTSLKTLLFTIGLTAFFYLPFLYYKEFMVSNTFMYSPHILYIVFLFVLITTFNFKDKYSPLVVASFGLAIPGILEYFQLFTSIFNYLPDTHYARFFILSLYTSVIYLCFLIDDFKKLNIQRKQSLALSLIILVTLFFVYFTFYSLPTDDPIKIEFVELNLSSKTHTMGVYRTIDFHLDNYLVASGENAMFTKGLFWESARNNVVLSSYLASLYSNEGLMLFYNYLTNPGCELITQVHDRFIDDFAIKNMIIPEFEQSVPSYLSDYRKSCYAAMLMEGSHRYSFNKVNRIYSNDVDFLVYEVSSKEDESRNNMVSIPRDGRFERVQNDDWGFMPVMGQIYYNPHNFENQTIFLRDDYNIINQSFKNQEYTDISFEKTGRSKYSININSKDPVYFKIKLNYYPGFKLIGSEGENLPLYDGSHFMVGKGKGEMTLVYKKTSFMMFSYIISLLTLIVFLRKLYK